MAAASASAGGAGPRLPIPPDLARTLAHPETPWNISRELFERMRKQESPAGKHFKTCEVQRSDPEYNFVLKYFMHQKPPGLCIRNILCIHNPNRTRVFEADLPAMEQHAQTFKPAWDNEAPQDLRARTTRRWEEQAKQFSPIEVRFDASRKERFVHIKVLPLWHGTRHVESICEIGFTFFGKHHMIHAEAAAGSAKSTDIGYFGSGIYFTNSSQYAALYNQNTLVLSWVAMRRPYPVVSDVPVPQKCSDMRKLEGQGAYQSSNAHFIPVVSVDPSDPECMDYHPCSQVDQPAWDEFVVFQSTQALPRFCVELGVEMPAAPAGSALAAIRTAIEAGSAEVVLKHASDIAALSQEDKNTLLILASEKGHTSICEALLKSGAFPSAFALHVAAAANKLAVVRMFLPYKELLDTPDEEGNTPLILAAANGLRETCEILLKAGANSLKTNKNWENPLHIAAIRGHIDVITLFMADKELLDAEQDTNDRFTARRTPFLLAAAHGHRRACELLLEAGANPQATNAYSENALHLAAAAGSLEVVQFLLATHKELLVKGGECRTSPLFYGARGGNREVCELLLKAGAGVEGSIYGSTVIHFTKGNIDIISALLTHKDFLEIRDYHGCTPLLVMAMTEKHQACALLLKAGANIRAVDKEGRNALHLAAEKGCLAVVHVLLPYKELLEAQDNSGNTPFLLAAANGHREVCETLLIAGANMRAVNNKGYNVLHVAAFSSELYVMQLLSQCKEYLEAQAKEGFTPFLYAAFRGHRNTCEALLTAGANVRAVDINGSNALHLAAARNQLAVVQMLLPYKELHEAQAKDGRTPFLTAVTGNHRTVCETLLQAGVNIKAVDVNGCNALHLAATQNQLEVVQMLLPYKEFLEAQAKDGRTPLLTAVAEHNYQVFEALLKAGANVRAVDNDGFNALHVAAQNNCFSFAYKLTAHKDLFRVRNKAGQTPLEIAMAKGHEDIARILR